MKTFRHKTLPWFGTWIIDWDCCHLQGQLWHQYFPRLYYGQLGVWKFIQRLVVYPKSWAPTNKWQLTKNQENTVILTFSGKIFSEISTRLLKCCVHYQAEHFTLLRLGINQFWSTASISQLNTSLDKVGNQPVFKVLWLPVSWPPHHPIHLWVCQEPGVTKDTAVLPEIIENMKIDETFKIKFLNLPWDLKNIYSEKSGNKLKFAF